MYDRWDDDAHIVPHAVREPCRHHRKGPALLVVTRYTVQAAAAPAFLDRARVALAALAAQPGWRSGRVGRAADDPERWVLTTEWDSVGAYRRALSAFDVKVAAVPLLSEAVDEPTAYEVVVAEGSGAAGLAGPSGRTEPGAGWADRAT